MGKAQPPSGLLPEGLDTAIRITRLQQKLQWTDPLSLSQRFLLGMLVPFDRILNPR